MAEAGEESVIVSRVLRTWGASESGLAESLQERIDALERHGHHHACLLGLGDGGHQGAYHRPGPVLGGDDRALDDEEKAVRDTITRQLGDIVFGVDDESMEVAVANQVVSAA